MSIQSFIREGVRYENIEDVTYAGKAVAVWEGRLPAGDDGRTTYTATRFTLPGRATRADVIAAHNERREELRAAARAVA